jgi:plasmid stabilization system protein ParE
MKVELAPEAVEDLEAVVDYLSKKAPQAAVELTDRVFTMIEQLAEGGLDGPEQRLRSGEVVRSWPVPPLRIYYQRGEEIFLVLRVYHQARRFDCGACGASRAHRSFFLLVEIAGLLSD